MARFVVLHTDSSTIPVQRSASKLTLMSNHCAMAASGFPSRLAISAGKFRSERDYYLEPNTRAKEISLRVILHVPPGAATAARAAPADGVFSILPMHQAWANPRLPKYGNLFDMYENITGENVPTADASIACTTMGGR